eukprot:scaffold4399_cov175-Ochromonas_danica.AAC.11
MANWLPFNAEKHCAGLTKTTMYNQDVCLCIARQEEECPAWKRLLNASKLKQYIRRSDLWLLIRKG